jgi:hypothetical protein
MLSALNTNRNYNSCCVDDLRPYIVSVDPNTVSTTSTDNTTTSETIVDITEVDELTVETLIVNQATIQSLTTFELTTTFISDFSVQSGDDVQFFGDNSENRFFWDSSLNTLYMDGNFKTRNCVIWLNNDSSESPLGISNANVDAGVLFKWYDDNESTEKLGYFGFKDTTERFTFIPNASFDQGNCVVSGITQENGDIEMRDLYIRNVINEDIGRDLGITSITNINMNADNLNLTSTVDTNINSSSDINMTTSSGSISMDITSGNMNINVNDGVIDILVDGDETDNITIENTQGTIDILTASTSSQAINIATESGGILIENNSLDQDIIIKSTNNIQLSTTGTTIANFNEDGITVNVPKEDYLQWITYHNFDVDGGIWTTTRTTPTNPLHFWRKDAAAETVRIFGDIDLSSRTTINKGYRLNRIYFSYSISSEAITSITPIITLKEFNPAVPTAAISLTNIAFTDINLAAGTSINEHYRAIDITTPFFLNTEGVLNIEIELVTPALAIFDFRGVHLSFDRNSF